MGAVKLTPPQPLTDSHDASHFACGQLSLDKWLKERALKNERSGVSRTYVVCQGENIVAYYCLATGSIEHGRAPAKIKRNMPDPIPVMILGRLAVDGTLQAQGLGRGLLKDALLRTLKAADIVGVKALLVHALDHEAVRFYRWNGFLESPIDPFTLMLSLSTAKAALK